MADPPLGPPAGPAAQRQYHVPAPTAEEVAASEAARGRPVPAGRGGAPSARAPEAPPAVRPARRAPATPGTPAAKPARRGGRRPRLRRPKLRWLLMLPSLIVVLVLALLVYGWTRFDGIERIEMGDALSAAGGGGTNYLLVGSDSREGTADEGVVDGQRSDTLLVMRVEEERTLLMSIPRDLYVQVSGTGEEHRINAAYNDGPQALVRTVRDALGIPVHHYLEVDFVSFAGLVDAVGGVTIEFPYPAFDQNSGLSVPVAGPAELDGDQALAFVRSRHYTEIIDGEQVVDPTGDLGRIERQQTFLRTVMGEVSGTRNPIELVRMAGAVSDGLRIDDSLGFFDALSLARRLGGMNPESLTLPTENFRTSGGAAVLLLREEEAQPILQQMGA